MRRKRFTIGSAVLTFLVVSGGASHAATKASPTTVSLSATFAGPYACLGPCAVAPGATDKGIARTDSKAIGTLTYVGAITEGAYDARTNCVPQQETLAFKPQSSGTGKNTFYLRTTNDRICFNRDPSNSNVSTETAHFTIGGGSGRYAKASGSGHFTIRVLTKPQHDSGKMTAIITY